MIGFGFILLAAGIIWGVEALKPDAPLSHAFVSGSITGVAALLLEAGLA